MCKVPVHFWLFKKFICYGPQLVTATFARWIPQVYLLYFLFILLSNVDHILWTYCFYMPSFYLFSIQGATWPVSSYFPFDGGQQRAIWCWLDDGRTRTVQIVCLTVYPMCLSLYRYFYSLRQYIENVLLLMCNEVIYVKRETNENLLFKIYLQLKMSWAPHTIRDSQTGLCNPNLIWATGQYFA